MNNFTNKLLQEIGIELEIRDGKPYYVGSINLQGTQITSLPDNLTVGGSLDLRCTQITSLPDNLTVVGSLYLRGTQITSLPDNLTVGGSLYLCGTQITSLPDNLTVGGSLYLRGTQITSLPDNLTVGGWLDLQGTKITSLPNNLTVGGSLYLCGTQITSLPDNLTVGGDLYLQGTQIEDCNTSKVNRHAPDIYTWRNNEYIKCDGIFSRVIEHKWNIWKVQSIGKEDAMYIVTDGNGKYAHGETIKADKADLIYKISNRDKSKYESLTPDSEVTFE